VAKTEKKRFESDPKYLRGLKPGSGAYGAAMTSPGNEEWKASQRKNPTHYSTQPNYPTKDEQPRKRTLRDAKKTYSTGTPGSARSRLRLLKQRLNSITGEDQKVGIRAEIKRVMAEIGREG